MVFYVLFTAPAWIFMFFLQHTCVSTQTTVLFLRGFLCSFYSSCVDFYVIFTAHLCEYTNNGAFPAWFFYVLFTAHLCEYTNNGAFPA